MNEENGHRTHPGQGLDTRSTASTSRRRLFRALALAGAPFTSFVGPDESCAQVVVGAQTSDVSTASSRTGSARPTSGFATVVPGTPLSFPRDHGSHPSFRIEWWYLTGWFEAQPRLGTTASLGVQITFFRIATGHQRDHASRFAARQLLVAHAALAIPGRSRLIVAERAARTGFGLAEASESDTGLILGEWQLKRETTGQYRARIADPAFSIELVLSARHPPLPQGKAGWSRKGPKPAQASHYYSRPRLEAEGRIGLSSGEPKASGPASSTVRGTVWFDHEWSSELLDPDAQGWDWVGLHLADGSSLMAFRIRRRDGGELWRHANWVDADQRPMLAPGASDALAFETIRSWRSPRSGAAWPVAQRLHVAGRELELQPLLDDQELQARASTGLTYWEGAVTVLEGGRTIGRGYLELTGYAQPMRI